MDSASARWPSARHPPPITCSFLHGSYGYGGVGGCIWQCLREPVRPTWASGRRVPPVPGAQEDETRQKLQEQPEGAGAASAEQGAVPPGDKHRPTCAGQRLSGEVLQCLSSAGGQQTGGLSSLGARWGLKVSFIPVSATLVCRGTAREQQPRICPLRLWCSCSSPSRFLTLFSSN